METEIIEQATNVGGYIISGLLLIGFAYFLYVKVFKNRNGNGGSGGGGSGRGGPGQERR